MKYFVDLVYPPTPEQAGHIAGLGWTGCAVYVGGPRAASHTAWHQVDNERYPVRDITPYFTAGFLPVCVGRNVPWDNSSLFTFKQGVADGNQANADTGACGFDSTSPLVLDVEYGTYEKYGLKVISYITGFASVANAAGHKLYVYGDVTLVDYLAQHPEFVDGVWGADWVWHPGADAPAPDGSFDPASPPAWGAWQFGGGTISGISVDLNSATEDFEMAFYAL